MARRQLFAERDGRESTEVSALVVKQNALREPFGSVDFVNG